jgi:hypothetical protein
MIMKRTCLLMALVALATFAAAEAQAARRPRANQAAVIEPMGDGVSYYVEVEEPYVVTDEPTPLHWSPRRGFHIDAACCREGDAKASRARVSVQRFAGIDPAAGRPVYVSSRGRF